MEKRKLSSLNFKTLLLVAGALIAGWALGAMFSDGGKSSDPHADHDPAGTGQWKCSMAEHPQIYKKPGKCRICAMDLVPLSKKPGKADHPRQLVMTETAKQLARITTVPVERRLAEAEIRLVGKVAFDETRTRTMAARFPARIDRLYVDYTGIQVRKGDHLARIYSPELLNAQRELLSAIKFGSNVNTAREKLRLWDFSEARISEIEKLGKPSDLMDINALIGGIVIEKHVNEGDYFTKGQPLFTIADLSSVWVKLDAYESDAPWLRYGQPVKFEAEAVPGKVFEGNIAFIAPTLDPKSRTIDIRVNAENPHQLIKPGMFVKATVFPTLAAGGKVIAPELKDKWISPMHPEIVRDEPGKCPVCGMALVKAEELGYSVVTAVDQAPLVVPDSAVLKTGKRSLVYVEVPNAAKPTYEGREVVLGPRAGRFYIIEDGLREGDNVVVEGSFKIDSALQIVAKPSMMNPAAASGPKFDAPPEFRDHLTGIFKAYLKTQGALANDDLATAKAAAGKIGQSVAAADMKLLSPEAHEVWMPTAEILTTQADLLEKAEAIELGRKAFQSISDHLIAAFRSFGIAKGNHAYRMHCPMAFENTGADWLQNNDELRNPYFGASMLKCGEVQEEFSFQTAPSKNRPAAQHQHHGK